MYSLVAMHPHLGERVLTGGDAISPGGERNLTWGRRVPASALSSWGSMPQLDNTMMRGNVFCICLPRHRALSSKCRRGDASPPGEIALPPSEDESPARSVPIHIYYIYTRGIIPFMFFSTKHKKIVPIICSFIAEQVLLPCYSFPAKKSLKKSFIL